MILSTSQRILLISTVFMMHSSMIQSSQNTAPQIPETSPAKVIVNVVSNKIPNEPSSATKGGLLSRALTSGPKKSTTPPAQPTAAPGSGLVKSGSCDFDNAVMVTAEEEALRPSTLGDPYELPTLPPQTATAYPWSIPNPLQTDEDRLLGLISDGLYNLADKGTTDVKSDPLLAGSNSNGLNNLATQCLKQVEKQRNTTQALIKQHRTEFAQATERILLLLAAINQRAHPKKIDTSRVVTDFDRIKEAQAQELDFLSTLFKEAHARHNHFKEIQQALSDAHLNGIPVSPRNSLKTFTDRVLSLTKEKK